MAETPDGKKMFVWGGLPGEVVKVQVTKKKRNYLEAIVTEVVQASRHRVTPLEPEHYLSTSPWQILDYNYEAESKQAVLKETFEREGVKVELWQEFLQKGKGEYGYRNKLEIGFWGDGSGIHFAHFIRGSHGKSIVKENKLCVEVINREASNFLHNINVFAVNTGLRAAQLKTAIFRATTSGEVVCALFVKEELDFTKFVKPEGLEGLVVYYSNPKSPASVATKELYAAGDITLTDSILGKNITYDVNSFFQVNLPVFEQALEEVKRLTKGSSVDIFSGVGAIGCVVGSKTLIESDPRNCEFACQNCVGTGVTVLESPAEQALEAINGSKSVIVDPPRAGLHQKLVSRLAEVRPPQIVYLSCNPITQARDVKMLEEHYKITHARGFNFFPRTPHIESLLILERK